MRGSASAKAAKTPRPILRDHPEIGETIERAIRGTAGLVAQQVMAAPGEAAADE